VNTHKNARLTPVGRAVLVRRVLEEKEPAPEVARGMGVSERTVWKWVARFRVEGAAGLVDRSSRPRRSPRALSRARRRQILKLRRQRRSSLYIAQQLQLPLSTVVLVQRRLGLNRLRRLEPPLPVVRYERARAGELLHLDVKKLGRIGASGTRGRLVTGQRRQGYRQAGLGWEFLHVAIDDYSRVSYAELLPDEQQASATAFLGRAAAWFRHHGVGRIERVMTDNGSAYISHAFAAAVRALGAHHLRTRPYTPRTNGKAERLIQTLLREWAYVRPYRSSALRSLALRPYLTYYNTQRSHTALSLQPPVSRLSSVNNLSINNS
jgi:transposase InsO family protein